MKQNNLKRRDNPLMMNSDYKNQMASLIDIIDKLKELKKEPFKLDKLIKEIFPIISEAIPYISRIFIIKLSYDGKIALIGNNNYQLKDNSSYDWYEEGVFFKNYEDHPLNISPNPAKEAVCISHLCKLPITEESYFLTIIRDEEKKHFLSHEIDAIRIYTRIVGGFINYLFSNELNQYMLMKNLSKEAEKNKEIQKDS